MMEAEGAIKKYNLTVDELKIIKREIDRAINKAVGKGNLDGIKMFCLMFAPESLNRDGVSKEHLELQIQILERVVGLVKRFPEEKRFFDSIDWSWNSEQLKKQLTKLKEGKK